MRRDPTELRKPRKFKRFHADARRPAPGPRALADCPDMCLLLSAAGPATASTRTEPREEKTLDTRKVDRGGASAPRPGTDRRRVPAIDTHTHFMPPSALGPAMAGERWHGIQFGRNARGKITSSVGGISQEIPWPTPIETADARVQLDGRAARRRAPRLHQPDDVLVRPRRAGRLRAWRAPSNDDLAEMVAARPDRFVGLGYLPLQDPAGSVAELERCVRDLAHAGRHDRHQRERARIGTAPSSSPSCRRPSSSARCSISTRRAAAPIPGSRAITCRTSSGIRWRRRRRSPR